MFFETGLLKNEYEKRVVIENLLSKSESDDITEEAYKIDVFINKNILIVDDITFADFAAGWMENRQKKVMKQSS